MINMGHSRNMPAHDPIDRVLHDFYGAEMPQEWPTLRLPAEFPPQTRTTRSIRNTGRLAIAASILFFVLGYLTLSAWFPPVKRTLNTVGPNIGFKQDRHESRTPMP